MNQLVEFKKQLGQMIDANELALPDNVKPSAFRNAAIVAAQDNPKVLQCERGSVMKSLRNLAAAGLVPDGREAALVPFKSKDGNNWVDVCQAMPMVFGLIKMVRRSGEVSDIRAHLVYQEEFDQGRFKYTVGDHEELTHEPILFGDKGPAIAAYAIALLKDGTIVREFMSAQEIDVVRRSSAAQRIYKKGQAPKVSDEPIGIWADWQPEMWKKTVIRRLCKRLDMSSEDMRHVQIEPSDREVTDVTPQEKRPGFADKVNAAREAAKEEPQDAPDVEDAEVVPDEEGHWTDKIDTTNAFPGGEPFNEGVKARTAGMKRDMCPHEDNEEAAAEWLAGFDRDPE